MSNNNKNYIDNTFERIGAAEPLMPLYKNEAESTKYEEWRRLPQEEEAFRGNFKAVSLLEAQVDNIYYLKLHRGEQNKDENGKKYDYFGYVLEKPTPETVRFQIMARRPRNYDDETSYESYREVLTLDGFLGEQLFQRFTEKGKSVKNIKPSLNYTSEEIESFWSSGSSTGSRRQRKQRSRKQRHSKRKRLSRRRNN